MNINTDKKFYKMVAAIAIPIALQSLITFGTSMTDTIMLGRADNTGILLSASALANQPFFILSLLCFGLSGAATVLVSQYHGKGDMASIRAIFSIILKVTFVISLLLGGTVLVFSEQVMSLYSNRQEVITAGADYLRIIGFAYFTFGISNTLICCLRGIEVVKISVVVNVVSFAVNIIINWILIFGNLGAPAMGIRGAAIGTLTARLLEFFITFYYLFVIDKKLNFRPRHLLLFHRILAWDLLKRGAPVVVNEFIWSLGITIQAAILGHISYSAGDPVAANSVAGMVQQLSTIFIFGLANAAAVMVGKAIGENRIEEAKRRASTLQLMSLMVGLAACAFIFLIRNVAVNFYTIPESTKQLSSELMVVIAVVTIFVSVAATLIVGVLRGAGDTWFCLFTELFSMWAIAIPLAWFAAFTLHLPVPVVLICMKIDEPVKVMFCLIRMRGNRWLKSVTRDFSSEGSVL